MAIRNIRKYGDELLRKKSRKIEKIDDRILTLLEDMVETMYNAEGVGLAAPQVGILKKSGSYRCWRRINKTYKSRNNRDRRKSKRCRRMFKCSW